MDTSQVVRDVTDPTGIFVVQRGYPIDGHFSSVYYPGGSAGSRLSGAEFVVHDLDPSCSLAQEICRTDAPPLRGVAARADGLVSLRSRPRSWNQ